jgi:hypothetical protein
MARVTAVVAAVVLLTLTSAARAQSPPAVPIPTQVRSLAENVLGTGLIRSISVTEGGATILMRWEAATYRAQLKPVEAREQLFGEAELVTGSIMGGIRSISRIRFAMARKDGQILANGINTRGPGVTLTFTALLGGGSLQAAPPKPQDKPQTSGGTSAAKD